MLNKVNINIVINANIGIIVFVCIFNSVFYHLSPIDVSEFQRLSEAINFNYIIPIANRCLSEVVLQSVGDESLINNIHWYFILVSSWLVVVFVLAPLNLILFWVVNKINISEVETKENKSKYFGVMFLVFITLASFDMNMFGIVSSACNIGWGVIDVSVIPSFMITIVPLSALMIFTILRRTGGSNVK